MARFLDRVQASASLTWYPPAGPTSSASYLLEDAARPLRDAGIDVTMHFREGDIAALIVDISEQLGCGRIWLPTPPPGGSDCSRGISCAKSSPERRQPVWIRSGTWTA